MRFALLALFLVACAEDSFSAYASIGDLSARCPGYNNFETGPCSQAREGSGWMGIYCYPNPFTYCICDSNNQWRCCGDMQPTCDDYPDPLATGDGCCAFDDGRKFVCSYRDDAGPATTCSCNKPTLTWVCR